MLKATPLRLGSHYPCSRPVKTGPVTHAPVNTASVDLWPTNHKNCDICCGMCDTTSLLRQCYVTHCWFLYYSI